MTTSSDYDVAIAHDKNIKELQKNKRIEACKLRYTGMIEYMTIQDMDIWLKLKEEIIKKQAQYEIEYYRDILEDYNDEYREELRYLRFKDKYC